MPILKQLHHVRRAMFCSQRKEFYVPDNERLIRGTNNFTKRVDAYLRLVRFDKQIGTNLLLLPCFWSIALASAPGMLPSLYHMTLFTIGALSARSAGCVINDFWDSDIDKYVERTKYRPLTTGEISRNKAIATFLGLTETCFGIAYLLEPTVTLLGFGAVPFVVSYPRFKRFFKYPQLMLGMTFNWGVWMGYAAVTNTVNLPLLAPLYLGGICWTIIYDTIYAFQDIAYDK